MKTMRVALVDGQIFVRDMMEMLCHASPEYFQLSFHVNCYSLVEKELKNKKADIFMIDICQPLIDGILLCKRVRTQYPDLKILVFCPIDCVELAKEMYNLGVHCYLPKRCGVADVKRALNEIARQGYHYAYDPNELLSNNDKKKNILPWFSPRELEVAQLACMDLTIEEMAAKLKIGIKTVEMHRTSLIAKTDSKKITGAVAYLFRNGFFGLTTSAVAPFFKKYV